MTVDSAVVAVLDGVAGPASFRVNAPTAVGNTGATVVQVESLTKRFGKVLPARVGEALRLGIVRRRVVGSSTATIAGTIVLETALRPSRRGLVSPRGAR